MECSHFFFSSFFVSERPVVLLLAVILSNNKLVNKQKMVKSITVFVPCQADGFQLGRRTIEMYISDVTTHFKAVVLQISEFEVGFFPHFTAFKMYVLYA